MFWLIFLLIVYIINSFIAGTLLFRKHAPKGFQWLIAKDRTCYRCDTELIPVFILFFYFLWPIAVFALVIVRGGWTLFLKMIKHVNNLF